MTREDEINRAYEQWRDDLGCSERTTWQDACKWADEHPKNPWRIFPKDIPNDGQEVILTWKKSGAILKALFQKEFVTARGKLVKNIFRLEHEEYKGLYSNIRWHDESSVTFWMPIPELFNLQEEK